MTSSTEPEQHLSYPKEKKTRRRLRLSCVECTKRRQRCDRNYPCGLCTQRGVSHLCRWETVPVARPAPARPPDHAGVRSVLDSDAKIRELSERIAMLERSLEYQKANGADQSDPSLFRPSPSHGGTSSGHSPLYPNDVSPGPQRCPSAPGDSSPYSSPEPSASHDDGEDQPALVLSQGTFEPACKLMQLTAGLRGEYLGNRGAWDLLHSILSEGPTTTKIPQFSLTDISSLPDSEIPVYPQSISIDQLAERIPVAAVLPVILNSFFTEVNWNFGLPEHWLYTAVVRMWNTLRYPDIPGSIINACWLSLLFAILACTPRLDEQLKNAGLESPSQYFSYAKAALSIAEESFHGKTRMSSATNGVVLACLAVPLLCAYQAKEGRLGESWKLVGTWIRIAQALEIHCDPGRLGWHGLSEEEKCLRKLAWCNLITWDKLYSIILGRPQMVGTEVPTFISTMFSHSDGATNFFSIYQSALIKLANVAGEVNVKCIAMEQPYSRTIRDLDESLYRWKSQLPYEYRIRTGEHLDFSVSSLSTSTLNFRQWYTLSIWFLYARMKLQFGYLTGAKESYPSYVSRRQCQAVCVGACVDILRLQCEAYELLYRTHVNDQNVAAHFSWDFIGLVALFEAVVGLISLLTKQHILGSPDDIESVVSRSIQLFTSLAHSSEGTCGPLAQAIATVLSTISHEISCVGNQGVESTPLSTTPSPPGCTRRLTNLPEPLLVFGGEHERWMSETPDVKYNWYPDLNTIAPPTVDMYAQSHARESHESTNLFRMNRS
ncbi:hypothetical protein E1B28_010038 [Marasmius oreades]|uniref:Zn(2)-C6 fungal-type domain-containing protein n=1 Tax=Marasmius oreades TaxID=181124 RepID=A0A9P7RW97_9AGAR|nr:uncharacterized protein E1B28_010038 [Marasmius oreades]KAG7090971.1 hypothetical protein E1B28_010038 [Marasmius oreades]